jgi:hypothetical protein
VQMCGSACVRWCTNALMHFLFIPMTISPSL